MPRKRIKCNHSEAMCENCKVHPFCVLASVISQYMNIYIVDGAMWSPLHIPNTVQSSTIRGKYMALFRFSARI